MNGEQRREAVVDAPVVQRTDQVGAGRGTLGIVIDGARRIECAQACLPLLKEAGVIIYDNADWKNAAPGLAHLREQGFRCLELPGLCALLTWSNTTAIFYRDGNCLGL